jgi:putative ABC transport system permease protein
MSFILRMAWRDSRASRRRLLLFSSSVVLGIAALVAIGALGVNLEHAIDGQAKGLLGADLIVTSRNALPETARQRVAELSVEQAREVSFSSMAAFPARDGLTRLVNVRALEGAFPFYGDLATVPAEAPGRLRAGGAVAIVEETLLRQFGTEVGGKIRLGRTEFTVVGSLQKLPGESSAFTATVAPRVLIPLAALPATGLAEANVLIRHRTMLRLDAAHPAEVVERELRREFRAERLGFDTVAERRRNLGRALENIEGFLSLVGFVALLLGAIGVASAIHVYIRQKIATVAVLRCLGATARQSFAVYLVQGVALGLVGALAGAALGIGVQFLLPRLLHDLLPFEVEFVFAWTPVVRGLASGLAICVLFTLLPLLAVRRVPPLAALRSAYADGISAARDPWRVAILLLIVAAVVGFSIWQTPRVRDGVAFALAMFVGFGVLAGLAKLVAWAARRWLPIGLPYVVRQGVANLHRPNNRTVLLLVSLGLGTFLMLTLVLTRTTLLREIEFTSGSGRPNLLLFDIQEDQLDAVAKATAAEGAPVIVQAPIVTMRMATLKGRKIEEWLRQSRVTPLEAAVRGPEPTEAESERALKEGGRRGRAGAGNGLPAWTLRREYRASYRDRLEGSERLVQGKFTGKVDAGEAVVPISLEEGLLKEMGLQLGDEIEWDVQGVPIRTRVTSVRAVEWRRLEPNFFVLFPEGVLRGAALPCGGGAGQRPEHSARIQRAVVVASPNVSAIDLALVLQTVDGIFTKVAFVIQFMAMFTVVTGVIVLAGAVLTGRFQRVRESVLLRTLGATRRQLRAIELVEYAVLGALAALVGGGLATAANALLATFIFRLSAAVHWVPLLVGTVAAALVTVLTGLLTSRGVADHPPLEVLRQET